MSNEVDNNEKITEVKKKKNIIRYSLRMTEDEHKKIQDKAFESHKSLNDYIKTSALGKDIIIVEGLKDLTLEIKRIGININQISKKLNQDNNLTEKEKEILLNEGKKIWQLLKQFTEQNL